MRANNSCDAERQQTSLLAPLERTTLLWLARRMPARVNSDHLSCLGFVGMFMAGLCYAASKQNPQMLYLVNLFLALNWFGDSLDGTLARYRDRQRPRYGFYVDHIIDTFGALFLLVQVLAFVRGRRDVPDRRVGTLRLHERKSRCAAAGRVLYAGDQLVFSGLYAGNISSLSLEDGAN